MRKANYAMPAAAVGSPTLPYQLVTAFSGLLITGVTTLDSADGQLYLQCQVPDNVTDAQVEAVISAWSPNDVMPVLSVSMQQACLALAQMANPSGTPATVYESVVNSISQLAVTDPRRIMWEHASTLTRSNSAMAQVFNDLGWTSDQVDAFFQSACQQPM